MDIKSEVKGINELNKRLFAMDRAATDALGKALLGGGKLIETACKQSATNFAAVDTGRMRASISTDLINDKEVHVAPHVEYAKYVEFGTFKMRERPFMKHGFEASRREAMEYVRRKLGEEIKMGYGTGNYSVL